MSGFSMLRPFLHTASSKPLRILRDLESFRDNPTLRSTGFKLHVQAPSNLPVHSLDQVVRKLSQDERRIGRCGDHCRVYC